MASAAITSTLSLLYPTCSRLARRVCGRSFRATWTLAVVVEWSFFSVPMTNRSNYTDFSFAESHDSPAEDAPVDALVTQLLADLLQSTCGIRGKRRIYVREKSYRHPETCCSQCTVVEMG